jgi:hypothetical protein
MQARLEMAICRQYDEPGATRWLENEKKQLIAPNWAAKFIFWWMNVGSTDHFYHWRQRA